MKSPLPSLLSGTRWKKVSGSALDARGKFQNAARSAQLRHPEFIHTLFKASRDAREATSELVGLGAQLGVILFRELLQVLHFPFNRG